MSEAEELKNPVRRVSLELELVGGGGVLIRDVESRPMPDEQRRLRLRLKQLAS